MWKLFSDDILLIEEEEEEEKSKFIPKSSRVKPQYVGMKFCTVKAISSFYLLFDNDLFLCVYRAD